MEEILKYIKKIKKTFKIEVLKNGLVIKNLSNPDYLIRVTGQRVFFEYTKEVNLKTKLLFTYLKYNYDFDGADIYVSPKGFKIYATHIDLTKKIESDMWIIRTIESIEKGLKEFYENDKE